MLTIPRDEKVLSFNLDSSATTIVDPFATPNRSLPGTRASSVQRRNVSSYFKSRRLEKGDKIEKPWLKVKDPRRKWTNLLPLIGMFIGCLIGAAIIWGQVRQIEHLEMCMVYEDDFSSGLNEDIWTKEAQVDGFSNGQFEETTITDENVFIFNSTLVIKPTLQDAKLVMQNSLRNLTQEGICTGTQWYQCWTSTNVTNGTIVNPVKSARINTKPNLNRTKTLKKGATIQYGRVEVVAKLPSGDWLWPAIWLLPVEDTYGTWPSSGEIDIVESRGNNVSYTVRGGSEIAASALHWGPDATNDAWWRTWGRKKAFLSTYADDYHTYGMEWTPKYLFTYIDTRLNQVMYTRFDRSFWKRGNFPLASANGTGYTDLWSFSGKHSTPFDKPFYLILNVAVGSQNGWFEDGFNGKPWVDHSPNARTTFWNARDQWYPTWQNSNAQMSVRSVKIEQLKGYNGC